MLVEEEQHPLQSVPHLTIALYLRLLLLLLALRAGAAQIAGHGCDVTAFGATGTGLRYDTQAIQRAIDSCAAQAQDTGGFGTVLFRPPGRFLTGTLFLRSHTVLHILPGATLLASPAQDHYPALRSRWYLLLAENVSDVGVTGGGIIDGQSSKFVQDFNDIKNVMVSWNQTGACYGDECRPRLIGFLDCQKVRIWNIHLRQPAYWCVHIVRSDDVSIHHVLIWGDFNTPNNDGIDIDSSNNTSIKSCHIDTGDDAICVKTNYGLVHNLTVSRCWIRTKSCAVKLGSQSSFNFHSLRFNDIQIVDSHRGLGLQLRDSGSISDVVFSNVNIHTRYYDLSWWGRAEPIYVTSCPRTPATVVGSITNVSFINIYAVSENGIFLSGLGGGLLRNIRLQNVQVQLQRTTNYTGGLLDYRPGCQGLVEHQNSGVFIKKISNLILDNVCLHLAPSIQTSIVPIEFAPATATESIYFVNFSLVLQSSLMT